MSCSYDLGIYEGTSEVPLYKYSSSNIVCKKGQTFTINKNDPNLSPATFQCPDSYIEKSTSYKNGSTNLDLKGSCDYNELPGQNPNCTKQTNVMIALGICLIILIIIISIIWNKCKHLY
jgi:hypothetical protein